MSEEDTIARIIEPFERQVVKDYGGWHNFMRIYNLKPTDPDDEEEARAIMRAFALNDARVALAKKEEEDEKA